VGVEQPLEGFGGATATAAATTTTITASTIINK
jgi:hypothetical protein